MRYVFFDSNYWKSFIDSRLAVCCGTQDCLSLSLFGRNEHCLFAEHLTAEGRGWTSKLRPERGIPLRLVIIDSKEWDIIWEHVRTADFPEQASTWLQLGRDGGFSRADRIFADRAYP